MIRPSVPEPEPEPVLRVATWNIHDARGLDGKRDLDRIAEMLGQLGAPLVGLLEVRCGSEGCDASYLARQQGYHWHAIKTWRHSDIQYGNALRTTLPVESTRLHDLSVGRHEPRAALEVHLPWQGQRLRVVVTHLGLRAGVRRTQVERLLACLPPDDGSISILLGDINEWWLWARPLRWLHRRFGASPSLRTYPARWPLFAGLGSPGRTPIGVHKTHCDLGCAPSVAAPKRPREAGPRRLCDSGIRPPPAYLGYVSHFLRHQSTSHNAATRTPESHSLLRFWPSSQQVLCRCGFQPACVTARFELYHFDWSGNAI